MRVPQFRWASVRPYHHHQVPRLEPRHKVDAVRAGSTRSSTQVELVSCEVDSEFSQAEPAERHQASGIRPQVLVLRWHSLPLLSCFIVLHNLWGYVTCEADVNMGCYRT